MMRPHKGRGRPYVFTVRSGMAIGARTLVRRKVDWRKGIAISQRGSAGPAFLRDKSRAPCQFLARTVNTHLALGCGANINESRQGRKNAPVQSRHFCRPAGARAILHSQPTVETVGYFRSSLSGLWDSCSSVVQHEVHQRVQPPRGHRKHHAGRVRWPHGKHIHRAGCELDFVCSILQTQVDAAGVHRLRS